MGRKRTPGLRLRSGVWHIEKVICGTAVFESTGTGSLEEAEKYLARRIEEIRRAAVYGIRPSRQFREAAARYLVENRHKASIADDAMHLRALDPYIGHLPIDKVHDGALLAFVEDQRKRNKSKSINLALSVVRRILNLAARSWRDEYGLTWLETPPLIRMLPVADARQPYPLSWEEQTLLFQQLSPHLQRMALFKVNTGTREQEVCGLQWDWEVRVPELNTSVFLIPGMHVKNREERLVVLNNVAHSVIEEMRGAHPTYVFSYKGRRVTSMNNTGWQNARKRAAEKYQDVVGCPCPAGFRRIRVHDLKHTFGRRLRAAGVPLETRKALLGHRNGDITTHYSAPEIEELLEAANKVCQSRSGKNPALTVLRRKSG